MDNLIRTVLRRAAEELKFSDEQKHRILTAVLARYFRKQKSADMGGANNGE